MSGPACMYTSPLRGLVPPLPPIGDTESNRAGRRAGSVFGDHHTPPNLTPTLRQGTAFNGNHWFNPALPPGRAG